jgi:hypothetical protein
LTFPEVYKSRKILKQASYRIPWSLLVSCDLPSFGA